MLHTDQQYWETVFERVKSSCETSGDTSWLQPYVPMWRGHQVRDVLEIGCGSGSDTRFLIDQGFAVTATDFAAHALELTGARAPEAQRMLHDTREPFPLPDESFDLIVASLSLHYFDRQTTAQIANDLKRLLRPRGLLLYRVNSKRDPRLQEERGLEIEPDFYAEDGVHRRYFDLESCRATFRGWEEIFLEEKTIPYYGGDKVLCEGLVRKIKAD
jgi:SAM-dependent methyltransferase